MSLRKAYKFAGMICFCGAITFMTPGAVSASVEAVADQSSEAMVAKIDAAAVSIYTEQSESSTVLAQATVGNTYDVLFTTPGGWIKVNANGQEGYIKQEGNATVTEAPKLQEVPVVSQRQQVVNYALQFVGGRYVYGGNDPNTGVDCSGFTRYVMRNAAGVNMNRSSGSQAAQGRSVSAAEIQPGDLVFYGSGKRINHVGIYIGNGQIVHASTERTGIKTSNWTYRTPVKIISVLG